MNWAILDRNVQAIEDFEVKKDEFAKEQAKASRYSNKTQKHAPRLPKMEEPIVICHCHQFHCFGQPQGPGNTCPWKCTDPDSKQPFGKDAHGMCLCPICICHCQFAMKVRTF